MVHTITVRTLQPEHMRYATLGDWRVEDGALLIEVSENCGGQDERVLVALHEQIEAILCLKRGITQKIVDDFDLSFNGEGEPGDELDAPYRREHRFAMLVEHMMAHEMGVIGYGKVE